MNSVAHDSILARYRIETCLPLERVAETIAGEQSSGTFLPVPGETEELKARSRAKVTAIKVLDAAEAPNLPGGRKPKASPGPLQYQRAEITLAFPFANLGAILPTLVATLCGNLFELSDHTGCKLLGLELPPAFGEKYPGPQFSVAGTRKLAGTSRLAYTKADYGSFRLIFTAPMNPVNNDHLGVLVWGDRPKDPAKLYLDDASFYKGGLPTAKPNTASPFIRPETQKVCDHLQNLAAVSKEDLARDIAALAPGGVLKADDRNLATFVQDLVQCLSGKSATNYSFNSLWRRKITVSAQLPR